MAINQILAGMPSSGKSTYVAALKHQLVSEKIESDIKLVRLSDAEQHLNRLEEKWLEGERLERTRPETEGWLAFHIRSVKTGLESELSIADLSGEAFRRPVATGRCDAHLYSRISDSTGLMLFTNADRGSDDLNIDDVSDLVADLDAGESTVAETSTNTQQKANVVTPFDPVEMPEEVCLVELLQIFNRKPLLPKARQLVICVSAWDVAVQSNASPESWLETNRPMLWQFVNFNQDLWTIRVYGVSAQGGVLPAEKGRLTALTVPSMRVNVVGYHQTNHHDLAGPLEWLLNSTRT